MGQVRYIILGGLIAVLVSCQTREIGKPVAAKPTGVVVFEDNFERGELGDGYKRGVGESGPGKWMIRNGWVHGRSIKNDPLWLTKPLPPKVRVEFDARSVTPEGDLKFEVFGDGTTHASGYIVIVGGWKNSLDVIARLDEHGKDRKAQKSIGVVPNKVYHFAVERTDNVVKFFVDGSLLLTFDDAEPLMGESHSFFAFNDWMAPVEFDNLKVYRLD